MSCFHRQEIKGAGEARRLQKLVGWSSTRNFKESIQNYQIRNCTVTTDDISKSEAIYAPQIPIIKGKATRRIPEHHKTIPRIPFPPLMAKHHQNVELSIHFFFVNGSTFLHTKLRKIDFWSVQACNNRGKYETIS